MPLLKRKSTVSAKIQSNATTAATLTAADANLLVTDATYDSEAELHERMVSNKSFARNNSIRGKNLARITFSTEVVGSGTAQTPATWGTLMAACGFSETVNGTTSVDYLPVTMPNNYNSNKSTGEISLTMAVNLNGLQYKIKNAKGSFSLNANAGEIATFDWEFLGQALDPSDVAYPALHSSANTANPPIVESGTFEFQGNVGGFIVSNISISCGNNLSSRDNVSSDDGVQEIMITDRAVTGSIDPEEILVANGASPVMVKRFTDGTVGSFDLTIGSTGGNKLRIETPADYVQVTSASGADREGVATNSIDLGFFVPNAEDATVPEIKIRHM